MMGLTLGMEFALMKNWELYLYGTIVVFGAAVCHIGYCVISMLRYLLPPEGNLMERWPVRQPLVTV